MSNSYVDWEFAKTFDLPVIRTVEPPADFEGERSTITAVGNRYTGSPWRDLPAELMNWRVQKLTLRDQHAADRRHRLGRFEQLPDPLRGLRSLGDCAARALALAAHVRRARQDLVHGRTPETERLPLQPRGGPAGS